MVDIVPMSSLRPPLARSLTPPALSFSTHDCAARGRYTIRVRQGGAGGTTERASSPPGLPHGGIRPAPAHAFHPPTTNQHRRGCVPAGPTGRSRCLARRALTDQPTTRNQASSRHPSQGGSPSAGPRDYSRPRRHPSPLRPRATRAASTLPSRLPASHREISTRPSACEGATPVRSFTGPSRRNRRPYTCRPREWQVGSHEGRPTFLRETNNQINPMHVRPQLPPSACSQDVRWSARPRVQGSGGGACGPSSSELRPLPPPPPVVYTSPTPL